LTNFQSALFAPSLSRDGRYVAYYYKDIDFYSASLRVFDTQLGGDIYTNSLRPLGAGSSKTIGSAVLSPNGKRVLYWVSSGTSTNMLFLDDVATGTNVLSADSTVQLRNGAGWSGDGRFLAFVCNTNPYPPQLFLFDSQLSEITVINTNLGPTGSLSAWFDSPSISGDGRFVAYRAATNYFPWVTNPPPYLFLFDQYAGTNQLISANPFASNAVAWLSRPAISGSGNVVAFLSMDSNVSYRDFNDLPDAYLVSVPLGAAMDSDGDGIPDWWMILHFGHATGLAGDLSRALDDADGDGMLNWQEWIGGTVPTDPTDRLVLGNPVWTASGVTLTWQSVDTITYFVERSSGVSGAPFSAIQSNIAGRFGSTSYTDTNMVGSKLFLYRVGVQ
jgi:Tol biopolymer transport system component